MRGRGARPICLRAPGTHANCQSRGGRTAGPRPSDPPCTYNVAGPGVGTDDEGGSSLWGVFKRRFMVGKAVDRAAREPTPADLRAVRLFRIKLPAGSSYDPAMAATKLIC